MKKQKEDYTAQLLERHEKWEQLYKFGGKDPLYSDGVNLSFVRSHICNLRGKIEETIQPDDYPEVYFKEIPPEVDKDYMARKDEIRAAAKVTLSEYFSNPDYQFVVKHQHDYSQKTKKNLFVDAVLGYAKGLEKAIADDDLITMRRHERAEFCIESFENCAQKMRQTPAE